MRGSVFLVPNRDRLTRPTRCGDPRARPRISPSISAARRAPSLCSVSELASTPMGVGRRAQTARTPKQTDGSGRARIRERRRRRGRNLTLSSRLLITPRFRGRLEIALLFGCRRRAQEHWWIKILITESTLLGTLLDGLQFMHNKLRQSLLRVNLGAIRALTRAIANPIIGRCCCNYRCARENPNPGGATAQGALTYATTPERQDEFAMVSDYHGVSSALRDNALPPMLRFSVNQARVSRRSPSKYRMSS